MIARRLRASRGGADFLHPAGRLDHISSYSHQPIFVFMTSQISLPPEDFVPAGVRGWLSTSSAVVSLQPFFFHLLPQPQLRVSKHDVCCSHLRNISKIAPSTSCHLCPKALISPFPITTQHALDHIRWFRLTCVEWLYRYPLPTDRASRTSCGCHLHGQDAF